MKKKLLSILIVGIAIYGFVQGLPESFSIKWPFDSYVSTNELSIETAFKNKQSDIQVGGSGRVIKILPDDRKGSRHQKFILKLNSGQSLLIAHNIDIAPRINTLKVGDTVSFNGEYEWNARGGVLHWTHRDPKGLHEGGWLDHDGKIYE